MALRRRRGQQIKYLPRRATEIPGHEVGATADPSGVGSLIARAKDGRIARGRALPRARRPEPTTQIGGLAARTHLASQDHHGEGGHTNLVTDERRQCPASGAVWGRTKIRAAGATDDSFGLVLHVCCTQHSFRLGSVSICPRRRGLWHLGASASPPPQVQYSLPERQIGEHLRVASTTYCCSWWAILGLKQWPLPCQRKRAPTELIASLALAALVSTNRVKVDPKRLQIANGAFGRLSRQPAGPVQPADVVRLGYQSTRRIRAQSYGQTRTLRASDSRVHRLKQSCRVGDRRR